MKLYVHINNQAEAFTFPEDETIGSLSKRICERHNFVQISLSKYPSGKEIHSDIQIRTFFDDMDEAWAVKITEKKEEIKEHIKAPEPLKFVSLTKYSFYEYDNNWVRVEVPFEGIGKHDKSKISCEFDTNSFVLSIFDKNDKNYQFSVLRLQCHIQPSLCKYTVLADKIRISLRKVKDTDNWFALYKTKTIGGDD